MPDDFETHLERAQVDSTFHRFAATAAELDRAERLKAPADRVAAQRAALFQATGRLDEALKMRQAAAQKWANSDNLSLLASVEADLGQVDAAARDFHDAAVKYRDVSPFVIAWIELQQGILWQRAGRISTARDFFTDAHDRLPAHAAVASHLAGVLAATGDKDEAMAVLAPVASASEDPSYLGDLAAIEKDAGHTADAEKHRAEAAARFEGLLKRHPEAFADHAARFYLADPQQAARALALGEANFASRKTPEAYGLVVDAALGAGKPARACEAAGAAVAAFPGVAQLHVAAWKAFAACGQKQHADAELKLVEAAK